MSNIFAEYKSGDIDPSSMKKSCKVSEIVNCPFSIDSIKRLEGKSKFSEDPTYLVNAKFSQTGEEFIFFAQQKVVFDKMTYLKEMIADGTDISGVIFMIKKVDTKDGKSYYYDIIDASE